jgi:ribosomal protein S18 acetylase RimI-like enzyme
MFRPSVPLPAVIRKAAVNDLAALVELCAAHAAFECASFSPIGLQERLSVALFGPIPRALVFVAESDFKLVGYVSCSKEFSTWASREFLHMDCLYVSEAVRGQGIGRTLLECVFDEAKRQNMGEVQWQTPAWNDNAIQFYRSAGATYSMKARFRKAAHVPNS